MTGLRPSATQLDAGLLVLRLIAATIFMAHGGQKLFVYGIGAVGVGFGKSGIPMPSVMAAYITILELVGGVALALGGLTRIVAVLLALDMAGAIGFVHAKNGFFLPTGMEFTLTLLCISVALALMGAGRWSIDGVLARRTAEGA